MDFAIVDCHGHIFPPLAGACGFPDAATHSSTSSAPCTCTATSPIGARATTPIVAERPLWERRRSLRGRPRARCRASGSAAAGASNGETDGERHYVQFLPPHMQDLSAPRRSDRRRDGLCRRRHRGPAERPHLRQSGGGFRRRPAKRYPGPFHRPRPGRRGVRLPRRAARSAARSGRAARHGAASTSPPPACSAAATRPCTDEPAYDPLWRRWRGSSCRCSGCSRLSRPVGSYEDEMRCLARIIERHPAHPPRARPRRADRALCRRARPRRLPDDRRGLLTRGAVSSRSSSTRSPGAGGTTTPTRARTATSASSTTASARDR